MDTKKRKDLISVIVPIYNVEKYLEKCIKSIQDQDYTNLDIVLVDDGSSDSSGKIADSFCEVDSRIRVVHKANSGVSSARNTGLSVAKGKYICFIDGDDYVASDYVSYLYSLIITNRVDISLTTDLFTNFDTKQVKKDHRYIVSGEQAVIKILSYNIPIGVYCKMFSSSFLYDFSLRFDEELFMGEGFSFNVNSFLKAKEVSVGRKRVYFYRKYNETSATTQFSIEKWENALYAIEKMHNSIEGNSKEIETAWRFARWRAYSDAYNLLLMSGSHKNHPDMLNRCIGTIKKDGKYAFLTTTPRREKMRAFLMLISPSLFPELLMLRRRKHKVFIKN